MIMMKMMTYKIYNPIINTILMKQMTLILAKLYDV